MSAAAVHPSESHLLTHISWETYECILRDYRDQSGPRFAYDRGVLEITSPSFHHEKLNRRLADLVKAIAEVWEIDTEDAGSTTFRNRDAERGFEPDSCFYVQNLNAISGKQEIDLQGGDPPPDVVIEVEQTVSALPKLPLFQSLLVPEVWRVARSGRVTLLLLSDGVYVSMPESQAFPGLTDFVLTDFLESSVRLSRITWMQSIRLWATETRASRPA